VKGGGDIGGEDMVILLSLPYSTSAGLTKGFLRADTG
jgi:hypothetical protein